MAQTEIEIASKMLPNQLIIYPMENKVVFPGMITQMMTNKAPMMKLIDKAMESTHLLGMIMLKDPDQKDPYRFSNLYRVGVAAKIHKKLNMPDGSYSVYLSIMERFTINRELSYAAPLTANVSYLREEKEKSQEITALTRSLISGMKSILENNTLLSEEVRLNMINIDHPGQIADFLTAILDVSREDQQDILETVDLQKRIEKVLVLVNKEQELLKIQKKIQGQISETVEKHRKEHFLREMLKEIKKQLGEPSDGKSGEIQEFKKKIESLPLPAEVREQLDKEVRKLEVLEPQHPEYGIIVGYLEKATGLPWADPPARSINIARAKQILDKEHYGMEKVKDRILEHLAASKIEGSDVKSVLCLVGPPGVGKTSIARSIATALHKKLYHFSVGGMRDEAEIKGHRRTYIGAMPGKVIQGLLYVKEKDPVFIIDEIDKLSHGVQGDPSSALLEVLDPVQNNQFRDLYLDLPFDLSKIFFITTANTMHTIPAPLIDRMEVIELSGYIDKEKYAIAQQYIIPKALAKHGVPKSKIKFSSDAVKLIAESYAREAGMRRFEQRVNTIVRKVVTDFVQQAEAKNAAKAGTKNAAKLSAKKTAAKTAAAKNGGAANGQEHEAAQSSKLSFAIKTPIVISARDVERYLGTAPYPENVLKRALYPGTSIGLAWTAVGGDVLVIEAQASKASGPGSLKLTGTLGDVMKESAHIAYSVAKQYESTLIEHKKIKPAASEASAKSSDGQSLTVAPAEKNPPRDTSFIGTHEIHLHVPAGATPKDGPSAGITMASALVSLLLGKTVRSNFAMTGELSLTGQVLPIGGLREKIVAARRNGIKHIIIPKSNLPDLQEIPSYITGGVTVHPVERVEEVFRLLFPGDVFVDKKTSGKTVKAAVNKAAAKAPAKNPAKAAAKAAKKVSAKNTSAKKIKKK